MLRFINVHSPRKVRFFINGTEVPAIFLIGNGDRTIHIKEPGKDYSCVTIIENPNEKTLDLDNYYNEVPIRKCPEIPHGMFFKLIECIARALHYPSIRLNDQSHKRFGHVEIPKDILSLAKSQTFYNRYGFNNEDYSRELSKLQPMLAKDKIPLEILNSLPGYAANMTLRDVAVTIIKLCQVGHAEEQMSPIIENVLLNIPEFKSIFYFVKPVNEHDISYEILHSENGVDYVDYTPITGKAGKYLKIMFSDPTGGMRLTRKKRAVKSLKRAFRKMRSRTR
jgi:hypothetical protein